MVSNAFTGRCRAPARPRLRPPSRCRLLPCPARRLAAARQRVGAIAGDRRGLLGLALGAEIDLIAFLTTRYLRQRAFGEIYGYLFMAFLLGSSAGGFSADVSFDRLGSYTPALIGFAAALVGAAFLVSRLGPYVYLPVRGACTVVADFDDIACSVAPKRRGTTERTPLVFLNWLISTASTSAGRISLLRHSTIRRSSLLILSATNSIRIRPACRLVSTCCQNASGRDPRHRRSGRLAPPSARQGRG
jgi:hypothetical protein